MEKQLKKDVLESLRADEDLQFAIRKATKPIRSIRTIQQWIRDNDTHLTLFSILSVISKSLNKPVEDLLEEPLPATA